MVAWAPRNAGRLMTCAPSSRARSIAARRAARRAALTAFSRASRLGSGMPISVPPSRPDFWLLCGLDLPLGYWPGGGFGFLERLPARLGDHVRGPLGRGRGRDDHPGVALDRLEPGADVGGGVLEDFVGVDAGLGAEHAGGHLGYELFLAVLVAAEDRV